MLFEIKIAIVILASIIAGYTDFKKGYIYDWLTYPFIIVGAVFAVFSTDVLWAFLQFALVFGIGYLFYRVGKLGGGDIKFLSGVCLFFPFYAGFPFVLGVLLFASLIALVFYGVYYLVLLLRKPTKQILVLFYISLIVSFLLAFFFYFTTSLYFSLFILLVSFFSISSLLFKDILMNQLYKQKILLSKLLNDDIVDFAELSIRNHGAGEISKEKMFPLSEKEYEKLKKILTPRTQITVYRNLPVFGPFITVGVVIAFLVLPYFASFILFTL